MVPVPLLGNIGSCRHDIITLPTVVAHRAFQWQTSTAMKRHLVCATRSTSSSYYGGTADGCEAYVLAKEESKLCLLQVSLASKMHESRTNF